MRTSRTPRLTAAHAEHLLDGGRGTGPLPPLLAAAAGPGTAHELAGEAAARAAFATAQLDRPLPHLPLRSPPMPRTLLSRILAAKAFAVVALAAGTTGGVALAAGTTVDSGHVRHAAPASAGTSAPDSDDALASLPALSTPHPATTVRPRPDADDGQEGTETGTDDSHCRAVAAGLPTMTPAPLPPGAENEASEAAEHACAVAAPGRANSSGPGSGPSTAPGGSTHGPDGTDGNGGGKGRSAVRTTPPVPLPGVTNGD